MKTQKTIVLKFGSSVLRTSDDAPRVAHEIYRWVRQGWQVVAIVSAFEGETDQLLASSKRWDRIPNESATALLASTGELRSAAFLALALDRAGIEAQVLDVAAIGLKTIGQGAMDSKPHRVNVPKLRRLLARFGVLVLPGFLGRDSIGRTTLLGRGGSDCSALFLAHQLGVRCRLVKDVSGLFEWDPRTPGVAPRRFRQLGWDEALQLDGGIVQRKAIEFAQRNRQSFEVGGLFQQNATEIGDRQVVFCDAIRPTPRRVVLLGLGAVGQGVFDALQALPEHFEVVGVAVRDKSRPRNVPSSLLVDDLAVATQLPCDVLVELIGDSVPAKQAIERALRLGRHVVSANKRLLAENGSRFEALAEEQGVSIRWSAAVGGAVPVLELLRRLPLADPDVRIDAVLNGTTNYVLDRWQNGLTLQAALRKAQDFGFAEADATRDLDGYDAADKLVLIHRELTGFWIDPVVVDRLPLHRQGFDQWNGSPRSCFRQVASWQKRGDQFQLSVRIQELTTRHPLARLRRQENGVAIRTSAGLRVFRQGKGAGRWPTAEAVLADLFDIAARWKSPLSTPIHASNPQLVAQVNS